MRVLASMLFITAAVVQLLLGGLLIFSGQDQEHDARAEVGDLSSVSADLVSEEELAAMKATGDREAGGAGKQTQALGILALALAALLLVAALLVMLRKGPAPVRLAPGVLSMACLAAIWFLEGGPLTAIIALALLALGLILAGADAARNSTAKQVAP